VLSKNPLEPQRELASAEDAAQALRLAIIAELDAINLYRQLATAVKDDRVRRVLEDVTNEERTHFGEFLSLLNELDPQQAKELEAGAKEVAELLGQRPSDPGEQAKAQQTPDLKGVPDAFLRALQDARRLRAVIPLVSLGPGAIAAPRGSVTDDDVVRSAFLRALQDARRLRAVIPLVSLGPGAIAAPRGSVTDDDVVRSSADVIPLARLSVDFSVPQEELEYYRRLGVPAAPSSALRAATRLGLAEDSLIFSALSSAAQAKASGDWSGPGSFTRLLSQALAKLSSQGPFALVLSPADRAYLASVIDQAGVDELQRASRLVDKVVVSGGVPSGSALLLSYSPDCVDLVVGTDGQVDYLGLQGGEHRFTAWETLAVRAKAPSCVALIARA